MAEQAQTSPRWQKFRWLWFAFALYGLLDTPFAVMDAYRTDIADHRLIPVTIFAFAVRFGIIWLFFSLWVKFAPARVRQEPKDGAAHAARNG
jgi:hypothetical protein